METRAAYACGTSPAILKVTNLNNSGPGSLRAAVTASGPRVVIFEVSGTINLLSDITIYSGSDCLTVAGQTAPSPGIIIRADPSLGFSSFVTFEIAGASDVLIQHLRFRMGGNTCTSNLGVWDYGTRSHRIVFDHDSVSWGQDENIYAQADDITVWRTITSEGLGNAPGADACVGGGHSEGHGIALATKSTIAQSLMADNRQRNPYESAPNVSLIINNIVYNWYQEWGMAFNSYQGPDVPWYATVIGNRFIQGPGTVNPRDAGVAWKFSYFDGTGLGTPATGNQIYRSDNTCANCDSRIIEEDNWQKYDPNVGSPPPQTPYPPGYYAVTSNAVEALVLANVGARPADRDAVDTRIIQEVTSRTGTISPSTPDQVGGYPTLAQNYRALTPPANPDAISATGYTNLEDWLHAYAAAVE